MSNVTHPPSWLVDLSEPQDIKDRVCAVLRYLQESEAAIYEFGEFERNDDGKYGLYLILGGVIDAVRTIPVDTTLRDAEIERLASLHSV